MKYRIFRGFRPLVLLYIAFVSALCANGRDEALYTSDGDLSSTLINKVLCDSKGMVWVATKNGLNRFDGSKFTIFHNTPGDSTTLASDFVNNIFETSDGSLFVATNSGVQLYNPVSESFTAPFPYVGNGDTPYGFSDFMESPDGTVFTVGNNIFKIPVGDMHLHDTTIPDSINSIHCALMSPDSSIWLTKGANGIYRVKKDGTVRHYFAKNGPEIICMALAQEGTIYAGGMGFYRYNPAKDDFEEISLGPDLRNVMIRDIYPDAENHLLLASDGHGILIYNPEREHTFTYRLPLPGHERLKVHSITKDRNGNSWVGIYQKGLLKIPPLSSSFLSLGSNSVNTSIIGNSCVSAVLIDSDETLWVGTDNDGIYALNRRKYEGSRHYTDGVPSIIMAFFEDNNGNIWVGSYGNGMGIIDRNTGRFNRIKLPSTNPDAERVFDFLQLPDGDIMIATMGAGIFRYSSATGHISVFADDRNGINPWVNAIDISKDGSKLYAGTFFGLYIIDAATGDAKQLLPGVIVSAIHSDVDNGELWAATSDGLMHLDGDGTLKNTYTVADGLPSNTVYAIEEDGSDLWISTNRGLTRFNTTNASCTNYDVHSGLPNNEFSKNSSFRDKNGRLYFGGVNGVVFFDPAKVDEEGRKLNLRVTDFFIGDEAVRPGMLSEGRRIVDVPVYEAEHFNLGHNDNTFAIRINNLEYVDPESAEYFYSFDDGEWTRIISNNSIYGGAILTFSKVPSGKHVLHIKAMYRGVESDPLSLTVDVAPAWWATWWASLIFALIVIAIAALILKQMRHRALLKQQEVERRHNDRMMESKLQFYSNISHEIRTPLTLVISPLQKLQEHDTDPERNYTYRTILRNAKRILRLINEMMDLRKIDNNQMKMRFVKVDLCGFLTDLYETFLPAAKTKDVTLDLDCTGHDRLDAWIDNSNFDKIVMNLLSNALKFTPAGGRIDIRLSTGTDVTADGPLKEYAEVSVTDTGIGIAEEDIDKIFNRFFQASNNNSGGTGIGLHLTRQLVELHHGTITVSKNPDGEGTRFTVRIPMGNAHLKPEELKEGEMQVPVITQREIDLHTEDEPEQASTRKKKKGTVIVVEDDDEIRRYIATSLATNYKVFTYANGKAALDEIFDKNPDLVITDVMMPEMDGITLTRKIKQNINLNHIPVVVLTAKTNEENNIEALDSGASAFIPKPFSIDVVLKTVEKLIETNQRLRVAFSGQQNQEDKVEEIKAQSSDEKLMERVMREINKNLSNSDITVEMIAKAIGISRVHLHRKLKELTNQSTRDFIRNIRLQAAAKLLREKKLSVAEVSDLVGFKQPNNFSTCFKEMFGMTPTAYCAKYHDEPAADTPK